MDTQLLIILLFFAAAVFFISRRIYKQAKGKEGGSCEKCVKTEKIIPSVKEKN